MLSKLILRWSLFFILFTLNIYIAYAQELVFASHNIVLNGSDTLRMGNIDLSTCTYSTFREGTGILFWNTDISMDSDSIYYGYIPVTPPPGSQNRLVSMEFEPFYIGTTVENFSEPKEGMTCDRQGNLYLAGEQLSRWNTSNGQTTELGDLPPSMHCRGDLTFRQGKLYLSSIENTLVEVDLNNPMNSTVVMTFPPGTPEIHGLATVNLECDSVETYAAASELFNGTTIYRIDFDTWTLEEVCHFDFFVTGLASYDECIFPDCLITVDLDADNSTGTVNSNDFKYEEACSFPLAVTDADISLHSDVEMLDSIEIHLTNPVNGDEFLSLATGFNVEVQGNGTDRLTIVNNGTTEVIDFGNALTNVLYNNDDPSPVFGERIIEVRAHFGLYQSTISRSYIPINEVIIEPSFATESISCYGMADGGISSMPGGGTAPYSFVWSNGSIEPGLNDISAGVYEVTISDIYACSDTFEVVLDQPDSLVLHIVNPSFDTICDFGGTLEAAVSGGTGSYDYLWSNAFSGMENQGLTPGVYTITVTDENECTATTSYTLFEGSDIISNINETPCYGTAYIVDGQTYTSDTTFCLTYPLTNACDSILCYTLDFYDENFSIIEEEICDGDSLLIFGTYYSTDVSLEEILLASTGCDSIIQFELRISEPLQVALETEGDLFQEGIRISTSAVYSNYLWSTGASDASITIVEPGVYQVTVTDLEGCTGIASTLIEADDTPHFFVPNIFSPNGDRINDELKVYGSAGIDKVIDLSIMSRNGHLVYRAQDFTPDESQQGWDGTFLGEEAQSGVYILYVVYEDISGQIKQEIYDLTLIR